jgi:hypothetical protein
MHFAQTTQRIYLSGTDATNAVPWQFKCTSGMNSNKWTTINVPSCWEQQGFGKLDYGFAKDSVRGKEIGFYKKQFFVANNLKGNQINIVFEGVFTDATVKVNGTQVDATHQGGYYVFKYDITNHLLYGKENVLEVEVAKHSANESVNNAERKADYWIFGGIYKPVYLEVLPEIYINEISFDAQSNGLFNGLIFTNNYNFEKIEIKIFDRKKVVDILFVSSNKNAISIFEKKIKNIKLWTPETPYLYTAVFTIYKNNKALHSVSKKIGFRTVEVKQKDGIYVNGVKVKMKGVNRAPFRPETGRTLSKQQSIEDVLLIKEMNMNAVRCSHYPPDQHFLDACDSLGLFVIDELAGWHGNYDNKIGKKLVKEMVTSDAHHPSIILWANGNEGGHNFYLDTIIEQSDLQNRIVIHPWQLHNGIETQHYREYNYGIGNYDYGKEIIMPTEFLHGQFDGGHGAGLEDYWERMWHTPTSAGGFLWDFADQAIKRKDKNDSLDTDKHRAADGILGPHFEKEASFFAIKEIWSPIKLEKKYITNNWDGTVNVENRFYFTNLNQCSFEYSLVDLESGKSFGKKIAAPNIIPNAKGFLKLDLPIDWKKFDFVYVTAKGNDKKEIFTWSFPFVKPNENNKIFAIDKNALYPTIKLKTSNEQDSIRTVLVGNMKYVFHIKNGILLAVQKANQQIPFNNGPILCEGNATADSVVFLLNEKTNEVTVTAFYPVKSLINTLQWTINGTGVLKMNIKYFPAAYFTNLVGVNFSLPETEIASIDYLGDGPNRVWKNRLKGNKFGIWHKDYNSTETGEYPWLYPEFKGYHSSMYWCSFNLKNKTSFTVYTETEDLFLRLFTPKWKTDQWHNYEPIFPQGDISFMNGISSIGSKTQRNETTGPMGFKNIFYDYEKDPSRALNMILYFKF